jgi:hypothetical protein
MDERNEAKEEKQCCQLVTLFCISSSPTTKIQYYQIVYPDSGTKNRLGFIADGTWPNAESASIAHLHLSRYNPRTALGTKSEMVRREAAAVASEEGCGWRLWLEAEAGNGG